MAANRVRVVIAYGELWSEVVADGVSYAPDAVDDMVSQCSKAFTVAISELRGHGIIRSWDDEEAAMGDLIEELMSEEDEEDDAEE